MEDTTQNIKETIEKLTGVKAAITVSPMNTQRGAITVYIVTIPAATTDDEIGAILSYLADCGENYYLIAEEGGKQQLLDVWARKYAKSKEEAE